MGAAFEYGFFSYVLGSQNLRQMTRLDALASLKRFRHAFDSLDNDAAFEHLVGALYADPVLTWHEIVRHHGFAVYLILGQDKFFRAPTEADHAYWRKKHDELVGLLDRFHQNHPEMICVPPTATTQDTIQATLQRRQACIDEGSTYFLFVSQEKSGSTSFGNIIPNGFRLPCVTYSMVTSAVVPSWAKDCARGGGCYVTHLRPHPHNIIRLRESGLTKVIINTRDPRQIFLSALHHVELYRAEFPDLEREGYFSLSFTEKARSRLPAFREVISWINGWVDAGKQGGLDVFFACFEDFVRRKDETVEKLLAFYGGNMRYFRAEAAHEIKSDVDYHFRRGLIDEWREVFDSQFIDELNAQIPNNWFSAFPWKP